MDDSSDPGRKLRIRERRRYTEEFGEDEEAIMETRMFSVEAKLVSEKFDVTGLIKEMNGEDFNLKFIQQNGFTTPVLVKTKHGLGIKIPDKTFTVNDVKQNVGSRRMLDVMDVTTQKDFEMTMKEWCTYFEEIPRQRLLNVISLEFSHTKLESMIESPSIVRQTDWVDWVWPKHLKESQTEATNAIGDMKYPKVQKYCLMSVKGCYTDFHIDFGGTSVWYHILHGEKVFWLIPPSEKNIQLFEQWVLSGKQTDIFFGDTVEQCTRIRLFAGHTFFIPTGWIHAVFTPEDSLVFGGNFLHSFGIEKQLRIAQVEDTTRVPTKFRYPFYNELLWYVLERYVNCLTGKTHQSCNEDGTPLTEAQKAQNGSLLTASTFKKSSVHLTMLEINGLKAIIYWLERLAQNKKAVPELIPNPEALLNDAKLLVDDHSNDDPILACMGKPALFWKTKIKNSSTNSAPLSLTAQLRQMKGNLFSHNSHKQTAKTSNIHGNITNQHHDSNHTRSESPPTRPISSTQYTVNSAQVLEHIPSSFADLIAATGVQPNNSPSLSIVPTIIPIIPKMIPQMPQKLIPQTPQKTNFSTQTIASEITHSFSTINPMIPPKPLDKPKEEKTSVKSVISTQTDGPVVTATTTTTTTTPKQKSTNDSSRRRRTRCKKCEACVRADCGECHFCKDMKKFGGPGRMKQSCIARQCMFPVLPHTACCMICGRDGWEKMVTSAIDGENQSSLMECSQCWEIVHPVCLKEKNPDLSIEGASSDDLPNSWECPKCIISGKSVTPKSKPLKPANIVLPQVNNVVQSTITTTEQVKRENPFSPQNQLKKVRHDSDSSTSSDSETPWSENAKSAPSKKKLIDGKKSADNTLSSPTSFLTSKSPSFVKSCARFPFLQEAINQDKTQGGGIQHTFPSAFKPASNQSSMVKLKKNSESLKDRLFKSLKSLKKKSEMRTTLSPNHLNFLKKQTKSSLSVKLSDSSSCGSNSAINSPSPSLPQSNSFFSAHLALNETDSSDIKVESSSFSNFDDDTDDGTDQEVSDIYEKSLNNISKIVKPAKKLVQPMYVVRPAPLDDDIYESEEDDEPDREEDESSEEESERSQHIKKILYKFRKKRKSNLALERDAVLPILQHLSKTDLMNCMKVCRSWSAWTLDPCLWESIDLSGRRINSSVLMGIVRRQPINLNLSWTNINRRQMDWLIARIPRLKNLSMSGCHLSSITSLNTCNCPLLKSLDLSTTDISDETIRELTSSPPDSRPGLNETKTRLRLLTSINLSSTDISDSSLRLFAHHFPNLVSINLSSCQKITDMGITILGAAKSAKLIELKANACNNISDSSLETLKRCQNLSVLDLRDCKQVSPAACLKFISSHSKNKFVIKQPKLIEVKA